jgi:hypothetical protein
MQDYSKIQCLESFNNDEIIEISQFVNEKIVGFFGNKIIFDNDIPTSKLSNAVESIVKDNKTSLDKLFNNEDVIAEIVKIKRVDCNQDISKIQIEIFNQISKFIGEKIKGKNVTINRNGELPDSNNDSYTTVANNLGKNPINTTSTHGELQENKVSNQKISELRNVSTLKETKTDIASSSTDFTSVILPSLAIIAALAIAVILSKNLFDKWKYGKNALNNLGSLKKAIGVKNELANRWLKKRKSANIHAIGVGKIDGSNDYCIQVFVDDANGEMLEDPPTQLLPKEYQNFPIVIFEMPRAEFLGLPGDSDSKFTAENARQNHSILRGGISGANANLTSEFGTIGYFFKPNFVNQAVSLWLKKHIYLLSNSHVFTDLTKAETDESDMILHPSPGESSASKSVAKLYKSVPIIFGGDVENPNFVDASIAKLHSEQEYIRDIPRIGKIDEFLRKEQVELRSDCHKFGRTTGYTQGKIFSIHLSIWVKYTSGAKEALFKDQFLIIPTDGSSFVKSGDSGSLVANFENKAVGLIFAGAKKRTSLQFENIDEALELENLASSSMQVIENYGVANSISDIMSAFNIKLDV